MFGVLYLKIIQFGRNILELKTYFHTLKSSSALSQTVSIVVDKELSV